MSTTRIEELGLVNRSQGGDVEVELSLATSPLMNPLTQRLIDRVQFTVVGDRLIAIGPPEMVGIPPIALSAISGRSHLEVELTTAFDEHVVHLQRLSGDLQALGIPAQVDPETLELSAHLTQPPYVFELISDKQGQFRVSRVFQEGTELNVATGQPFELSEFRERDALAGYLVELLLPDTAAAVPAANTSPAVDVRHAEPAIFFAEMVKRFGLQARIPPRSSLEVVVEMRVEQTRYRFAAARLAGRSFRGLLAGPHGKLWAGRFDLEDFPGVAALLAEALQIPVDSVELLPSANPGSGAATGSGLLR